MGGSKTPARRETLSRDRVLAAALELVDREGADAVSMRRLADALGVEAMSLYHHVESKAAVLDGIFERVLAELPPAPPAKGFRSAMAERGRALRAVLRRHPNALSIFATRAAVTDAALAHVEAALETLAQAGFSTSDALATLQVLVAFVVGHTVACYAPRSLESGARPRYDGLDRATFPRVRAAARALGHHDVEAEFAFGLDALIAGIEAAHRRRRRASAR